MVKFNDAGEMLDDLEQKEQKFRFMLWMNHGHIKHVPLYGDDGEMQCPACMIDFKRDDPGVIMKKITVQAMQRAKDAPVFRYGTGGALLCDRHIEGVTQELSDRIAMYYGDKYIVCETVRFDAAKKLAGMLGGILVESPSAV